MAFSVDGWRSRAYPGFATNASRYQPAEELFLVVVNAHRLSLDIDETSSLRQLNDPNRGLPNVQKLVQHRQGQCLLAIHIRHGKAAGTLGG